MRYSLRAVLAVAILAGMVGCQKTAGEPEAAAEAPAPAAPAVIAKLNTTSVEAGCAYCSYKMDGAKGCSLAIKVDGVAYKVSGNELSAHGEGLCEHTRTATVTGSLLDNNTFEAETIALGEPTAEESAETAPAEAAPAS